MLFHQELEKGNKGSALAESKDAIERALLFERILHDLHGLIKAPQKVRGLSSTKGIVAFREPPAKALVRGAIRGGDFQGRFDENCRKKRQ